MSSVDVRQATADDMRFLVPRLADAFAPQPLTQWLVGGLPDHQRRRERLMEIEFQYAIPLALSYTTVERVGAALWHPPGIKPTVRSNLRLLLDLGRTVDIRHKSLNQLLALLHTEQARPDTPHYYLAILAVEPGCQGQGIGSALLQPGLALCDTNQVLASLTTDTERNVHFYERHGFVTRTVTSIPHTDLRISTLWREPHPPS